MPQSPSGLLALNEATCGRILAWGVDHMLAEVFLVLGHCSVSPSHKHQETHRKKLDKFVDLSPACLVHGQGAVPAPRRRARLFDPDPANP
jgi:hypothetical protein